MKDQGHTVAGAKQKLSLNKTKVESQSEIAERLMDIKKFLVELREKLG